MNMQWLPPMADFKQALRDATSADAPPARLHRLAGLARHRLSYLEMLQLDRALAQAMPASPTPIPGFTALRLSLLSTHTVDHLLPGMRVAALRHRLLLTTHVGTYGQYRQELLDPDSALHRFKPDVVVLALAAREFLAGIEIGATREAAEAALRGAMADLQEVWRAAAPASVIQQTFLDTAEPLFGNYDTSVPATPAALTLRLNQLLADAVATSGINLLDISRAAARDGLDAWHDIGRWLQAKMEISPAAVDAYGEQLARILAAQRGLSRKCLVLDLDNTLWGGVIGDDGLSGIVLGEGSAAGEAHLALQRHAAQLARRGIILAVCSKNEMAIAEEVFARHPDMHLRRDDIACFIANWEPKAGNLREIARRLNIGLDSLVFVDDNPVERAAIRAELPEVAVPELPADASLYVRCLADAGYFEAAGFTQEDRQRSGQYLANAARDSAQQSCRSTGDFLQSLNMRLQCGRARDVDLPRVAQLINKTNQFNLTTRRHSQEAVAAFANDAAGAVLQFRLTDRFGDNGLVSVLILRPVPGAADALEIDTWVMSCRVFGRELEFEAMNVAVETARALGARRLLGRYLPTAKNDVVKTLYDRLGFQPSAAAADADGGTHWILALEQYQTRPTPIERSA